MIRPLGDRVLIKEQEVEDKETTDSGLVLPSSASDKPKVGQVVAVAAETDDFKPQVKKGDTVIFGKYSGTEVTYEGEDYVLVKEKDITAVVE